MTEIHSNSTVTLIYKGKLDNGELFKEVQEKAPLVVTLGNQELPPSVESALVGKTQGERLVVRVPPEEGYGVRHKMLLQTVSRESLGEHITPRPGMILSVKVAKDGEEHQVPATVMKVDDETVEIDYNHPLAGHHLTYHLHILDVQE